MAKVIAQRMTAQVEGDFVVFLIGFRINKPWKIHKWLPVFLAMPRMLRELAAHPESGFLGHVMSPRVIVQYWQSFDHLEAYRTSRLRPVSRHPAVERAPPMQPVLGVGALEHLLGDRLERRALRSDRCSTRQPQQRDDRRTARPSAPLSDVYHLVTDVPPTLPPSASSGTVSWQSRRRPLAEL